ncbi:hypothetical protein F4782DRAFT_486123, partial [Xylaria castorea]
MVELVTLSSDTARGIYPSESPKLDTALRGLICSCLATKSGNRPLASALANIVTTCIKIGMGSFTQVAGTLEKATM